MVKGWRWPNDRQGKHRGTGGGFWDILTGKGPDMYIGDFRDGAPDWTQWGRWPEQGAWPWHYDDSTRTPPWARRGYESYDLDTRKYRKRYPPPERFIYPPAHRYGGGGGGNQPWLDPGFDSSPWPDGPGPWVEAGVKYGLRGGGKHVVAQERSCRRPRVSFPRSAREANADLAATVLPKAGLVPQFASLPTWAKTRWEDKDAARRQYVRRRYPSWSSQSTDWSSECVWSDDETDWRSPNEFRRRRF